jgi:hypothetical protein
MSLAVTALSSSWQHNQKEWLHAAGEGFVDACVAAREVVDPAPFELHEDTSDDARIATGATHRYRNVYCRTSLS